MANIGNFGTSLILVAPSPATTGDTLEVLPGEGADFIYPPFYATVHPSAELPTKSNSEVVLVWARSTDTLSIDRAQKGTTAKNIAAGWRISNAVYAEDLTNQSYVTNETPSGAINGVNTEFTLASQIVTFSLEVYKNGIHLSGNGDDYYEGPDSFTMVTPPATGTILSVNYRVGSSSEYSVGTNSFISGEVPSGTVNGTNLIFTIARGYIANTTEVYINGLKQQRSVDYTETNSGTGTITMVAAPRTGDVITVDYQYNLNPSGNSDTVDGYHGDDLMPVGSVIDYASETLPSSNWLLCYGQAISRSAYSVLFNRLGTTYGVGDGSTTFNLPDCRGRVSAGQDDMGGTSANRLTGVSGGIDGDALGGVGGLETHTLTVAQMPSHDHELYANVGNVADGQPNLDDFPGSGGPISAVNVRVGNRPTTTAGSGAAHNNVQPTIIFNKIIKAL